MIPAFTTANELTLLTLIKFTVECCKKNNNFILQRKTSFSKSINPTVCLPVLWPVVHKSLCCVPKFTNFFLMHSISNIIM